MTEILGHDINGQPLRAGDRVVAESDKVRNQFRGKEYVVVGEEPDQIRFPGDVEIRDDSGRTNCAFPSSLRKLPPKSDHQPADEEFTKWLRGICVGVEA